MKKIYLVAIPILIVIWYMFHDNNGIEIQSTSLSLKEIDNSKIALVDKEGQTIVDGVMGFNINGKYFSGWVKNEKVEYFTVNLNDNKSTFFKSLGALNLYLEKQNQPRLHMDNEITYWDLKKRKVRVFSEYDN